MADIYFTKNLILNTEIIKKFIDFPKGCKVAVKMHMGEKGNKTCLRFEDVKPVVDALISLGLKPFIIDTPVAYSGGRFTCEDYYITAKENGFDEETIGCPIVISNDAFEVKTTHMDFQVCKEIYETNYMAVLSHVKGHVCAGFGGAIKNLSMGGATKKSKKDMHSLGKPKIIGDCKLCGLCVDRCPADAIKVSDKLEIDLDACWGCGICVVNCPNNVLAPKVALIDELLAEGAWATVQNKERVLYINMIKRITHHCDCDCDSGKIIADDIGTLIGFDPVAIDQASLDLIHKGFEGIFIKENYKDPQLQIDFSEKLGFGEKNYELKEI